MADAVASAWVEVLPDFSGFQSSVNSSLVPMLGAAGAAGGSAGASGFGTSMVAGIGKFAAPILAAVASLGIGGAIADAVNAGIDQIAESIDKASALQQSAGAVDAIFADSAATIHKWAAAAAADVGLSQNAYNELASIVGAQLKNLGVSTDEVAGKTNELITLGADLAAQFGGSTSDAVNALSSLLRGERDPIERYGVTINDARIKAKLLEMGLGDLEGAALEQAKSQATLALLYEQTAAAQGTFARESDTLAGAQQRQQAAFENLQAKLGTAFLPLMTTLANTLAEDVAPELEKLLDEIGPELTSALTQAAPAIAQIIIGFAKFLPVLAPLVEHMLPLLATMLNIIGIGFTAIVPGVVGAINVVSRFSAAIWSVLTTIGGLVGSFTETGKNLVNGFIRGIQDAGTRIQSAVLNPIRAALTAVRRMLGIASPSKVLEQYGIYTGEGFIRGVDRMRPAAQASMGAMVQVPRVPRVDVVGAGVALMRFDPESMRSLRSVASRPVEVEVDSQTVARSANVGEARLGALGAN